MIPIQKKIIMKKLFKRTRLTLLIAFIAFLSSGESKCQQNQSVSQSGISPRAIQSSQIWITEDSLFREPYIDIDEWRDTPVRHRYVHGGFKGTPVLFSFYFPPKEQYHGRFFQHITPVPGSETMAQGGKGEDNKIGFSISSGGYFVETNEGGWLR